MGVAVDRAADVAAQVAAAAVPAAVAEDVAARVAVADKAAEDVVARVAADPADKAAILVDSPVADAPSQLPQHRRLPQLRLRTQLRQQR